MEEFSAQTRTANLEAMGREALDVLVIGGGIVGAWTALTAAMRGYRTGLVEKGDFAGGTSGKTSRLIHGGLRYLQKFRLGIVREAARERDALLQIAPSLVTPVTFVLPVYRGRGAKAWQLRIGLWLYDVLSRDKVLPPRTWLSPEEALSAEPRLGRTGLVRAATYSDAMAHDARLVLAVVRKAAAAGALVANYARAVEILREGGRVVGAKVQDEVSGTERTIRARAVVNATGIWVGDLMAGGRRLRLRPTKGVHVFVPRDRVGHRHAVVLYGRDGRVVFMVPWGDLTLVGTTDTDYRGDRERVEAERPDIEYLLDAVNATFPESRLTPEHVVSSYAGLRPLIDTGEAEESDISRAHEVERDPDGLISVAGGKLTTARAMSWDIMRHVDAVLGNQAKAFRCPECGTSRYDGERACGNCGATVPGVRLEETAPVGPDEEALAAHSARHEMVVHLDDFFVRRTRLFYERRDHGRSIAPAIAGVVGDALGWDSERRAAELAQYREAVESMERWRAEAGDG